MKLTSYLLLGGFFVVSGAHAWNGRSVSCNFTQAGQQIGQPMNFTTYGTTIAVEGPSSGAGLKTCIAGKSTRYPCPGHNGGIQRDAMIFRAGLIGQNDSCDYSAKFQTVDFNTTLFMSPDSGSLHIPPSQIDLDLDTATFCAGAKVDGFDKVNFASLPAGTKTVSSKIAPSKLNISGDCTYTPEGQRSQPVPEGTH